MNYSLSKLPNLKFIDLNENRLEKVNATWFGDSADQLNYLGLSGNMLKDIESELFEKVSHLEKLDVSRNDLRCLDLESMAVLHDLNEIAISSNPRFKCWDELREFADQRNIMLIEFMPVL